MALPEIIMWIIIVGILLTLFYKKIIKPEKKEPNNTIPSKDPESEPKPKDTSKKDDKSKPAKAPETAKDIAFGILMKFVKLGATTLFLICLFNLYKPVRNSFYANVLERKPSVDPETLTVCENCTQSITDGLNVTLKPGQRTLITIPITAKETQFWNTSTIFLQKMGTDEVIEKKGYPEEVTTGNMTLIPGGTYYLYSTATADITFKALWWL